MFTEIKKTGRAMKNWVAGSSTYRCDMGWSDTSGRRWGCPYEATTAFGRACLCEKCAEDHKSIADKRQRGE